MNKSHYIFVLALIFSLLIAFSCSNIKGTNGDQTDRFSRVMFYNVENLFDIYDDPNIKDEEFMPDSKKEWNLDRYNKKLENISRIIIAVGELDAPDIIGLCEIENFIVLEDLTNKTQLKKLNYGIIHKDSPDKRGIDVAVLYRKDNVKPIYYEAITVSFGDTLERPTRDILYFKSLLRGTDTIHYFVNHWPSRYGGQEKSEGKRIAAATVLKTFTDSILSSNANAKIILTGDFNDDPSNNSLTKVMQVNQVTTSINNKNLYSLSSQFDDDVSRGSLKYKGKWNVFDQFIISGNLLNIDNGIYTSEKESHIFYGTKDNDFLLEKDTRYVGMQPNRTYWGPQFHGGFSDHLPIYLDLMK